MLQILPFSQSLMFQIDEKRQWVLKFLHFLLQRSSYCCTLHFLWHFAQILRESLYTILKNLYIQIRPKCFWPAFSSHLYKWTEYSEINAHMQIQTVIFSGFIRTLSTGQIWPCTLPSAPCTTGVKMKAFYTLDFPRNFAFISLLLVVKNR